MGYQSRVGSPRNSGRGRGISKHEKAKAGKHKHRSAAGYAPEENHVPTLEEATNRMLNTLHNLGNQRFALSPFSEHLDRWLVNLRQAVSEFESSPEITVDDQYINERSQILSNVELDLAKRRQKETTAGEVIKILSDNRILLEQIEKDYANATKKIAERKDTEIKRLSSNIDSIRQELDRIAQMKTGIFRAVSKNTKAQKETEATQRLNAAQSELTLAMQHFTAEQEASKDEHERREKPIAEQIQNAEKEIQSQEIDDSLEARRAACEALINSANSLLQRKGLSHN
jgi:vacuolar-type H+-ATPase subunit I/STV1